MTDPVAAYGTIPATTRNLPSFMNRDIASITSVTPGGKPAARRLPEPLLRIVEARHHDPFEVLGKHSDGSECVLRAFLPHCDQVRLPDAGIELSRTEGIIPAIETQV